VYSVHRPAARFSASPRARPSTLGWGRAALSIALALILFAPLPGCQRPDPLSQLDLEAQRIIDRQQQRSLGAAALPPNAYDEPATVEPAPTLYEDDPDTTNPAAAALDIEARPATDSVDYPAILDDGTQPDTLRFDLESLLAYAIEHAPSYRNQKESLFLTTLSLIVERHEWGPRFFSTITGRIDGVPEAGDTDTALNLIASLGVTQRLPYGGTVSAAALVDYVRFLERASTNTLPDETQATELQVSLDLPLLRGAGRTADTVETRLQAERDLVYAVRGFERFRREFFVDLATTYFNLLRRQQQLVNREAQLANLEQSAELFTALAEAGRTSFYQAQRSEQRVLRARNILLNQQEGYARQLDRLKLQIGLPTTRPVEILAVQVEVPEALLDPTVSVQTGLDLRLDLQTEADRIDDARRGVLVAKNRLLPDLDVTADLALPTDETVERGGLDFELGDGEYSAGISLGLPLDRKIEYTDYRAALIRLEQQKRDHQLTRDQIALEIRSAVRAIEQARFLVQLQDRAVAINERRAEQIEINQRDLGPREVIDVQEDLLDARDDRDAAESNLRISILEYLLATGQMRVGPDGGWLAPGRLMAEPVKTEGVN
jgi:outer membrane protein TolC